MMSFSVIELKQQIKQKQQEQLEAYQNKKLRPDALLKQLCRIMDKSFIELIEHKPLPTGSTLCAVGGYGRGELFPYSDIDILILLAHTPTPEEEVQLSEWVTLLWDLGLDIGHSVRTSEECLNESNKDVTVETALLEARYLCGNKKLFNELMVEFKDQLDPQLFFQAKMAEKQQRYTRYTDSPYELEPNCKESPGGLRDIHMVHWIARALGLGDSLNDIYKNGVMTEHEAKKFKQAETLIKRIRIELHLLNKKRDDRLLFHTQPALAEVFKIKKTSSRRASEVFMQRYYIAARNILALSKIMLQQFKDQAFPATDYKAISIDEDFQNYRGQLDIKQEDVFIKKPSLLLKVFLVMQENPQLTDMSARTKRAVWQNRHLIDSNFRNDPKNAEIFISILKQQRGIVHGFRRMVSLDILPQYIPPFKKILGQMQHDLFHVYTVDLHTLMVIRTLRRYSMPEHAQEYPLASSLISDMDKPWLLYIAALFHDIAKGRGGDHSTLGAVDVARFAKRLNLEKEDIELLVFLVKYHLYMSSVGQKKDLSDPEVIKSFVDTVKTKRRLAALYLLTMADMRGTGPKVWNAWKGRLMADLYYRALAAMGDNTPFTRQSVLTDRKEDAKGLIRFMGICDDSRNLFWDTLEVAYFLRHDARDIAWHTRHLYYQTTTDEIIVKARPLEKNLGLQLLIYTKDHPALFEKICHYFYTHKINILDAKIHTTDKGYALDSFIIEIPHIEKNNLRDYVAIIEHNLTQALIQDVPPEPKLRQSLKIGPEQRRSRTFPIVPSIELFPDEKAKFWRLSLSALDSPGLLYSIASLFTQNQINLSTAKIMTLGERVEDIFIISSPILENAKKQLAFERSLYEKLSTLTTSEKSL